jgi:hypothetical protein
MGPFCLDFAAAGSDEWSRKETAAMMKTDDATNAYSADHAEALCLLEEITELVEDLPAPDFDGFEPNWGHVADLEQTIAELRRIRDRMARRGEYAGA